MERAVSARRSSPWRAIVKGVLHVVVKVFILTTRAIKRHPIPTMILAVILAGSYFAVDSGAVTIPGLGVPAATARDSRVASIEEYLDGQRNADVLKMMSAFSDENKADSALLERTQQQVTRAKLHNIRFVDASYIGGTALMDGGSVHLYVVSIDDGAQTGQIPFTFTLNAEGKIARIE